MLTILALVDGSKSSSRAVRYVIAMSAACKDTPDVHLLNVQLPVASGIVARHVRRNDLDAYYHDEGMAALAPARKLLDKAGVPHAFHIGVGEVGETVAKYVKKLSAQQIAMGTRGLGPVAGMLLGSMTTKVVHAVNVPIVLVK
jgi:Universal stress protein UspA and related nucleotide-binding proteins